jgi:hypothetical protein
MLNTADSLYAAWYQALPAFFRGMMPPGNAPSEGEPAEAPAGLPYPANPLGKALEILGAGLTQLYQSYLPLLAQGGLNADAFKVIVDASNDARERLLDAAARSPDSLPEIAPPAAFASFPLWHAWHTAWTPGAAPSEASNLLQLGMERAFGGLGDAFGLRPARELEAAWREIGAAAAAKQRTQAEYLALWAEAWGEGTQRMLRELSAMAGRGERVESMLALIRLWATSVDAAVHEALQSERGVALTAAVTRAATSYRHHLQKAVALASESMHLPTQADIDEAYREIQELKRELRRLKKALPPAQQRKLRQARESES